MIAQKRDDHRVDIAKEAQGYDRWVEHTMRLLTGDATRSDRALFREDYGGEPTEDAVMDYVNGSVLEVEVWRRESDDARRAEILFTVGGPTVRVLVDESGDAELYHSWGRDPIEGEDCHRWTLISREWENFVNWIAGE